ncbi:hypothetical protein TNCV_1912791 [Trichonephila clavipes]|nr:hypothetical protein TNCV_1912791 [Trichonephila clavipes]
MEYFGPRKIKPASAAPQWHRDLNSLQSGLQSWTIATRLLWLQRKRGPPKSVLTTENGADCSTRTAGNGAVT